MKPLHALLLAASVFTSGLATAHEFESGELHIDHPWSKEVPPMSSVAAAFSPWRTMVIPLMSCCVQNHPLLKKLSFMNMHMKTA
ncbi:hypothetical protein [Photobacterium sp. Hal280]|uniref:hypothetical protein n=1 Tax=Photobacterium sp. Hal280 TaxID=3035163 RepID=UPI00301DAA7F